MRGLALGVIVGIVTAAACRAPRTDAPPAAPCSTATAPAVRMAVTLPAGLDPSAREILSTDAFSDAALLSLDITGRVHPAIVRAWETQDQLTWTFTLRDGLRTQDGEALTAPRVRDLLKVALEPPFYSSVSPDVVGIDAPTPTTIVIKLARPNLGLLEALAMIRLANESKRPDAYAGPFRLVRETPDAHVYEPFRETWKGPPSVAGLHVNFYSTPRMAWAAFLRNEADVLYDVPPDAMPLLERNRDVRLINTGSSYTFSLLFQHRDPLLRDSRVRQALNLAIDRAALAQRYFKPYAVAAHGPFSPDFWAAQGAGSSWSYDPAAARALLQAAAPARTQPIELECLIIEHMPIYGDIAAAIEAQLQLVNVRLRLVPLPNTEVARRLVAGDFQLYAGPQYTGRGALPAYLFWHSRQVMLKNHYISADAPLDRMLAARSEQELRAAVRDVLATMRHDPPAAFILAIPRIRAVSRRWRVPDDEPDIRRTIPYWTLASNPPCEAAR